MRSAPAAAARFHHMVTPRHWLSSQDAKVGRGSDLLTLRATKVLRRGHNGSPCSPATIAGRPPWSLLCPSGPSTSTLTTGDSAAPMPMALLRGGPTGGNSDRLLAEIPNGRLLKCRIVELMISCLPVRIFVLLCVSFTVISHFTRHTAGWSFYRALSTR